MSLAGKTLNALIVVKMLKVEKSNYFAVAHHFRVRPPESMIYKKVLIEN